MTSPELGNAQELLKKVRDYNEGRPPYRFHGSDQQREQDAFDAWQMIKGDIDIYLASRSELESRLQSDRAELITVLREALSVHGGDVRFGPDENEHSWCTAARALLQRMGE